MIDIIQEKECLIIEMFNENNLFSLKFINFLNNFKICELEKIRKTYRFRNWIPEFVPHMYPLLEKHTVNSGLKNSIVFFDSEIRYIDQPVLGVTSEICQICPIISIKQALQIIRGFIE